MTGNPRLELVVEQFCDYDILLVVLFHSRPRVWITRHALNPQVVPFVRRLANTQQLLSHVVQLVAGPAEHPLDRLVEVDLRVRPGNIKSILDERTVQSWHVILATVVSNDGICHVYSLVQSRETPVSGDHVVRSSGEAHTTIVVPLPCRTEQFTALDELVQGHMLIAPELPQMRQVRRHLNIKSQDLHSRSKSSGCPLLQQLGHSVRYRDCCRG